MLWGIIGILVLVFVSLDILWTTLLIAGGGPLTNKVITVLWPFFLFVHKRTGNHKFLSYGGLVIILINLLCWVGLTWLGWSFIFISDEQAILESSTLRAADLGSRIYYVGFILITLGIGDYIPGNNFWQIITTIASANGFIFITLSITYLLPIVSAVIQKRQFGGYIFSLGDSPNNILNNAWNGDDYDALSPHLSALTPQILELGQKHLAYPILHCFHTPDRQTATAPNLVALDESLTILEYAIPSSQHPDKLSLNTLRHAISLFIGNRHAPTLRKADAPPPPNISFLPKNAISSSQFKEEIEGLHKRRQLLNALIIHDGWEWTDVTNSPAISNKELTNDPTLLNKSSK